MDRVVLGGCFLLLVLGLLLGVGISTESSTGKSIRDALELLGFAGTAITAVVAVFALTSWQAQFRHSEKWKAIKDFQESLAGGSAANAHISELFLMISNSCRTGWESRDSEFLKVFEESQKRWFKQCCKVDKAWQELLLFFDAAELKSLASHRDIEKRVGVVVDKFMSVHLEIEPLDMVELYSLFKQCSISVRDDTSLIFKQSRILQKQLVG